MWNNLLKDIVHAGSLTLFRNRLRIYMNMIVALTMEIGDVCTQANVFVSQENRQENKWEAGGGGFVKT